MPLRSAVAQHLAGETPAAPASPALRDAAEIGQALGALQVPDAARFQVSCVVRELDSGRFPAGRGADALQRRSKRIFPAAGALCRFPH